MSLLQRSLANSTRLWMRTFHSTASRTSVDSVKAILKVPRKPINLDDLKRKPKDRYDRLPKPKESRETPEEFLKHREKMNKDFPEGWNPPRKLSREAMLGLRTLHRTDPEIFSTPVLAERFKVSPEAVRRILKSRWSPSKMEKAKLLQRDRRRKLEFINKRIERETAQIEEQEKEQEQREKLRWGDTDRLSFR